MSEEINVEELMNSIESPAGERPMTGGDTAPPAEAPDPNAWRKEFDWTLDVNGQKISPDNAEKARTWLQQGYNYSQRAAEINAKERDWQAKLRDAEERINRFKPFEEVDRYARENPDWWKFVEQQYQQRGQQGLDPNVAQHLQPFLQRIQSLEGFVQQAQTAEQQRIIQEQDKALDAEIESIRKSHPNIDLSAVDESGRTLEWRILNHANENKINSFRAAFRDYLHDKLVEEAKASSRVAIAQNQEQAAKKGLLGKTPTPTKVAQAPSVRGRSYDDLTSEALKSFGIN